MSGSQLYALMSIVIVAPHTSEEFANVVWAICIFISILLIVIETRGRP
jgi:hypothetical protein